MYIFHIVYMFIDHPRQQNDTKIASSSDVTWKQQYTTWIRAKKTAIRWSLPEVEYFICFTCEITITPGACGNTWSRWKWQVGFGSYGTGSWR